MNLNIENIFNAYSRLKKSIYYDNNHFLKRQVFEYENDGELDNKLNFLLKKIQSEDASYFDALEVECYTLPKSINKENLENSEINDSTDDIIKNFNNGTVKVDSVIHSINVSIEYHIISVLWIINIGYKLVKDLKHNYGNILIKEELLKSENCDNLFEIYWGNYRLWRDNAINVATDLHKHEKDAVIVALDIKEFYGSVRINNAEILKQLESNDFLTKIIISLCTKYTNLLHTTVKKNTFCLPIGLLSSPIIANWYLSKLDAKIIETNQTHYYGRYVDDILCVFNHHNTKAIKNIDELIELYFEGILDIDESDKSTVKGKKQYKVNVENRTELLIQHEKFKVMLFHNQSPLSLLENFSEEIRKSSSEFRLFPKKYAIENDFNYASTKVIYNGSINKLRSIKEFVNDSFAISVFLTKAIFMAIKCGVSDPDISKSIIKFFDHENLLKSHLFWEKIFAYFIAINDSESLFIINNKIDEAISEITVSDKVKTELDTIKANLIHYKKCVLTYILSLTPNNKKYSKICNDLEISKNIQVRKMLNHKYYKLPSLQFSKQSKSINLLEIKINDFRPYEDNKIRKYTVNAQNTLEFMNNVSQFGSKNYCYSISDLHSILNEKEDN